MNDNKFTDNDIDAAYLLGVFTTGGLDALGKEIARLQETNKKPHEFIFLLKSCPKTAENGD